MNRLEITQNCPKEFEDILKEFIDYYEEKFKEISNICASTDIDSVGQLQDCCSDVHTIANECSDDLY